MRGKKGRKKRGNNKKGKMEGRNEEPFITYIYIHTHK
jgi:hypothetical protein